MKLEVLVEALQKALTDNEALVVVDKFFCASLSTGPPDIQIESIAEGYIVVVVPQLQRGIQLSGYQTKNN